MVTDKQARRLFKLRVVYPQI